MGSEVETILNEIRERVRATERERAGVSIAAQDESSHNPVTPPTANGNSPQSESLARVSAHLMTTSRAWDRLPPVFSNRSGLTARLELWIKARCKALANWFTWEQVNFNAAVHHALSETLEALSAHEKQLRALRSELNREAESGRISLEKNERELRVVRDEIETLASESRRHAAKQSADLERQSAAAETLARETKAALGAITARLSELAETSERLSKQSTEMAGRFSEQSADAQAAENARLSEQAAEVNAHLSELAAEISSRLSGLATEISQVSNDLREEQRVCFKQLSLEASEAAVLEDRGRRAIESRLGKLEKRDSGRQ
jgi:chromosome segregation ATPase